MEKGLPLCFDIGAAERLHSLAYIAALQSGAKGRELDEVTSQIFRSLAAQANRAEIRAQNRPSLKLVEGGGPGTTSG